MESKCVRYRVICSVKKPSISHNNLADGVRRTLSSTFKPLMRELEKLTMQVNASRAVIQNVPSKALDACFNRLFKFVDQPLTPSQSNFAPVEELNQRIVVTSVEGQIPDNFTQGVYIRNGSNPLFGGFKSTESILGQSNHTWIEGEGMLHAIYFTKNSDNTWTVSYNNRYVESKTYKLEKHEKKPSFLPAIEGHSSAILSAYLFNLLRFGKANKDIANTSVFELGGRFFAAAENHLPQEIDICSLQTLGEYDVNGSWKRPFTSHPKKVPGTGELVIVGVDAVKPFVELGIISDDGKRLLHKVDLQYGRSVICHDIGITQRYNVLLDCPLTIDIVRLLRGGSLIKYDGSEYARIGVMPRYGSSNSIKWFGVEPNITFHILNCFEDDDEVVVRGCRALESIIPGPEMGEDKFEWFSRGLKPLNSAEGLGNGSSQQDGSLFSRFYEWRLNLETGEAVERNLTGTEYSMEFPIINERFTGSRNKYGYTQLVDSMASKTAGLPKYGGLAKLYLEELETTSLEQRDSEGFIKVQYHMLPENTFCTGAAFVPKQGGTEEDDGWIISFVHNEATGVSEVYIVGSKNFSAEPVAKVTLSHRVPYGFHGSYMPLPLHHMHQ